MNELLLFLLPLVALWFWRDSMRARERALLAARSACAQIGAQHYVVTSCLIFRWTENNEEAGA